jgi:hypothetical protein
MQRPLPFARVPVRRKEATHHLALKIISERATPQSDVVCQFSFSLLLTRLLHSFEKSAKDAPQDADSVAPRRVVNVSS